jgi:hypothetical protein
MDQVWVAWMVALSVDLKEIQKGGKMAVKRVSLLVEKKVESMADKSAA